MDANEYDSNLHYIKWRAVKAGGNATQMRIIIHSPKNPSSTLSISSMHQPVDPQSFRVFFDQVSSNNDGNNILQSWTRLKKMLSESNTAQITRGPLVMTVLCGDDVNIGWTLAHTAKV